MHGISLKSIGDIPLGGFFTKTLPPIVTVILLIVIANNLAKLTWLMLPQPSVVPAPVEANTVITKTTVAPSATNNVVAQISNWHIFGQVQKEVPKPIVIEPEPEQEAPDTTLQLTLMGVAASRDMMNAWAIIADRSRNEDTYSIDDDLPDNAVLKEIYADRVILLHNGRRETLRLPQNSVTGVKSSSRATGNRSTRSTTKRRSRRSAAPRGSVNHLSYEATQIVKSYKEKLLNDPQSVMNTMRAEPYRQGGQLKGYRIFPGRDKKLFGQVGLEPGDVVTAVNGIELNSPLKGLEVMQNIQDAAEVSVNVVRNGVNQTFVVPLN